ncbi:opioid-binding protein/cell adhesion molecule homolog [Ptychodera flava]|uniref:opioid-binding protein/cell adhesion molecule homolog n=1 Tax=Ptychodera flava TaxID=63121 RepID=UPI003969E5FB
MILLTVLIFMRLMIFSEGNPVWNRLPESVHATVGQDVTLHCWLTGLVEGRALPRWEHGQGMNKKIISKGSHSTDNHYEVLENFSTGQYNIIIKNVTLQDGGPWHCSHIEADPQTKTIMLIVEGNPVWNRFPESVHATVGQDVTLHCWLTGLVEGRALPRWEHGQGMDKKIISKGSHSTDNHYEVLENFSTGQYNIIIKNVTLQDGGPWHCSHIEADPQTKTTMLIVEETDDKVHNNQMMISPCAWISTLICLFAIVFHFI